MTLATRLLTAEEYALLPDNRLPTELVQGKVVTKSLPYPRHGQICFRAGYLIQRYLDTNDLGLIVTNDAGVITERDPDSVRGPDVAFYSYARAPRGALPRGYLAVTPDLAIEVRSSTDRWREIHAKVAEYLAAGVTLVCVLDEQTQAAHVFHADQPPRILSADEELALPEVLGTFRVPVQRFFE